MSDSNGKGYSRMITTRYAASASMDARASVIVTAITASTSKHLRNMAFYAANEMPMIQCMHAITASNDSWRGYQRPWPPYSVSTIVIISSECTYSLRSLLLPAGRFSRCSPIGIRLVLILPKHC